MQEHTLSIWRRHGRSCCSRRVQWPPSRTQLTSVLCRHVLTRKERFWSLRHILVRLRFSVDSLPAVSPIRFRNHSRLIHFLPKIFSALLIALKFFSNRCCYHLQLQLLQRWNISFGVAVQLRFSCFYCTVFAKNFLDLRPFLISFCFICCFYHKCFFFCFWIYSRLVEICGIKVFRYGFSSRFSFNFDLGTVVLHFRWRKCSV